MNQPFILGLKPTIPESLDLTTQALYDLVGQNSGNLAFYHAINQQLGGDLKIADWGLAPEQIDKTGSTAVLPCSNQVGPHANFGGWAKKFAALNTPIVAIGLGAQGGTDEKIPEVPLGTQEWIRAIADHAPKDCPNITVRGPFSMRVLEHYGLADRAVVMGCPTLFISPDINLGRSIAARITKPKRIAVAAGHQRWTHLSRIEASLAQMVTATSGSYVGQSPLEMLMLTRGEADKLDPEALEQCRRYAAPEMDLHAFIAWTKAHGNIFFDVPKWMEHYRDFDFVIGTRIHGVMLALQAGVPGLCIVHDSRTLELCQTMLVPYVLAKNVAAGIKQESLLELLDFDPVAFDRNRRELGARYITFLSENGLQPTSWLSNIGATEIMSNLA